MSTGSWHHGLFDCFSPMNTCCLAFWCPCIQYGKTQGRKDGNPDVGLCTGTCWGWYALSCCGAQGILQTLSRGAMRKDYGIQSNACNDFLISCCCTCCSLIQEDKEVKAQEEKVPLTATNAYAAPNGGQGMMYHQQQPMGDQKV